MQRNLDRRVETTFPVEDKHNKRYLIDIVLKAHLKDNTKARILLPNGKYIFNKPVIGEEVFNSQEWLMDYVSTKYTKEFPKERKGKKISA